MVENVAIAGSVAMRLGIAGSSRLRPTNAPADVDLVATSIDAVRPSVVARFFVSHYHAVGPGVPKFMIQLVDPLSRVRVDIFPDLVGSIADAPERRIGEFSIRVLPLARILEHKGLTLSRASRFAPIDPKHVRDACLLGELLGMEVPDVAPEVVAADVYGTEDLTCRRCELSTHPDWPLAPKEHVFDLLGWSRR